MSSVSKLVDPQSFVKAVSAYGLLPNALVEGAAWLLIVGETALASALLTGYRDRLARTAAAGALCMFVLVLATAVLRQLDIACGCFGPVASLAPSQAMAVDLVMLVPLLYSLVDRPPSTPDSVHLRRGP